MKELSLPTAGPTPSGAARSEEERELVAACMAEMPERERELIVSRNYAGEDWQTVADRCGAPSPDAARMLYNRALVRLGGKLRGRGVSRP